MSVQSRLLRAAVREYLEYDASLFRRLVALGGTAGGALLWTRSDKAASFQVLSQAHRLGGSALATRSIERALASLHERERRGQSTGLWNYYSAHVTRAIRLRESQAIVKNPKGLLGYRVLVIKRATERERGVIAVDYSYVLPLFAALFDLEKIGQRYHIVLEPSWTGFCTPDILAYSRYDFPVFVETVEPRDAAFIASLGSNLHTVPIAANWWVDHRLVKPRTDVKRDIDVIMVASWAAFKRHWRFFRALADLRRRGHTLSVALLGYPVDKTMQDIVEEARYFGVQDQLQFHERLPLPEVGHLLSRSKSHVLWSRKEGSNRAIIEAMFADVPIVVREGLSYGHRYPYINEATGRFANERTVGDELLAMIDPANRYRPREWAMANMSCQRATEILTEKIRAVALAAGEPWTEGLAVKTTQLEQQRYWDPADRARFEADYAYLESNLRSPSAG